VKRYRTPLDLQVLEFVEVPKEFFVARLYNLPAQPLPYFLCAGNDGSIADSYYPFAGVTLRGVSEFQKKLHIRLAALISLLISSAFTRPAFTNCSAVGGSGHTWPPLLI
jgi:hypothetical protein